MKKSGWVTLTVMVLLSVGLLGCSRDEIPVETILAMPKSYVGSEQCKVCHLEHYDSWKTTLHSRTLQDVTVNQDALITDIKPEVIRADLMKQEKRLKVPVDEIYIRRRTGSPF